ncbi:MAG: hypothetical protein OI860_00140 (plasmid) [Candidatus Methanoperedens sp.]|nr:MAG: hypothetical protein OI863_00325 [Candidatus Methanoperedens sp.]WAM22205.1 MAG: hypothetical protein OI860_00140 [Candidatus Methanoperedens sp.]
MILDKIFFLEIERKKLNEELDRLIEIESANQNITWIKEGTGDLETEYRFLVETEETKEISKEIEKIDKEIERIEQENREKESKEYWGKITNEKGQIITDSSRFTGVEPIIKKPILIHEEPQEKKKPDVASKTRENLHR